MTTKQETAPSEAEPQGKPVQKAKLTTEEIEARKQVYREKNKKPARKYPPGHFHPNNGFRSIYLRSVTNEPMGVILTDNTDPKNPKIGWSLCNFKYDTFCRAVARELAVEKMKSVTKVELPDGLRDNPMNHGLMNLIADEDVPHTVKHYAKLAIEDRIQRPRQLARAQKPKQEKPVVAGGFFSRMFTRAKRSLSSLVQ